MINDIIAGVTFQHSPSSHHKTLKQNKKLPNVFFKNTSKTFYILGLGLKFKM